MNSPSSFLPGRPCARITAAILSLLVLGIIPARADGAGSTATGTGALQVNTGSYNTADGFEALFSNTTGADNTAVGANTLRDNTTGNDNTVSGLNAMQFNTGGSDNTADGCRALAQNTSGAFNTASGVDALRSNTRGSDNTAGGANALSSNTTGSYNVADGWSALISNTTGNNNTASGLYALASVTTGSDNIAVGSSAGANITTGSNNIEIGTEGMGDEASTIRIGAQGTQARTFLAGVSGVPLTGATVVINSLGQLGVAASSQRFKDDIHDLSAGSEALYSLRPVAFKYKPQIDPAGTVQFGLVAEEVEQVDPALVIHDPDGKPFTVRYEQVNAMLLNEFLKEHARVAAQESEIAALKAVVADATTQIQAVKTRLDAGAAASPAGPLPGAAR